MDHTPQTLAGLTMGQLMEAFPFVTGFFADEGLDTLTDELEWTVGRALDHHRNTHEGIEAGFEAAVLGRLADHIETMLEFVADEAPAVQCVTVLGGRDKSGAPEAVAELCVRAGEVLCVVGPTGSGKSRLLADIEWAAQGDTPTGRRVLIDGEVPDRKWRFSTEHKLVAQLSQNMNFVMDLSVEEFLALHAQSRRVDDVEGAVARVFEAARGLCGEPFELATAVTALSGGQSRALMIADVAILSRSPIVLIDEIENAGIDRKKALQVLLGEEKIVLMATHDPIIALSGQRRLVLSNGAMQQVITPTAREREHIALLADLDQRLMALRDRLRRGDHLEELDPVLARLREADPVDNREERDDA